MVLSSNCGNVMYRVLTKFTTRFDPWMCLFRRTATSTNSSTLISQVVPLLHNLQSPDNAIDPNNYLFWVMLVTGNISRCQGCGGKIKRCASGKPLLPPEDLVMQHKESNVSKS